MINPQVVTDLTNWRHDQVGELLRTAKTNSRYSMVNATAVSNEIVLQRKKAEEQAVQERKRADEEAKKAIQEKARADEHKRQEIIQRQRAEAAQREAALANQRFEQQRQAIERDRIARENAERAARENAERAARERQNASPNIGAPVHLRGNYAGASTDGNAPHNRACGWDGLTIGRFINGANFPYLINHNGVPIGWCQRSAFVLK